MRKPERTAMPRAKADEFEREERRKKVAANLLGGMTYREMARACDVSIGTISNDVKIILGRWKREQIQDTGRYVDLELRRLDIATNAIWDKITGGDLRAVDRLLKIQERRAKYLSLDQPIEFRMTDDELLKRYLELLTGIGASGSGDETAGHSDSATASGDRAAVD